MKKMLGRGLVLAFCLLMVLGVAAPSMAAPATYPCLFYGTATVDDEPVAGGTEITAWVGSEQVGLTHTGEGALLDNQFSLVVELATPAEVSFKIGQLLASETATWVKFGSVEVNLTATTAVVTYPCLFYGTAQIDGVLVGPGITISAWVGSEQVGSTTTGLGGLAPDQYCLVVELATPAEVSFKIGELLASETAAWVKFGSVEVNLTATTPPPTPSPPTDDGTPPTYYTKTDLFGVVKSYTISYSGKLRKIIEATSEDGMLTITIPKGTIALDKDGRRLKSLEAAIDESPPCPSPEDAYIIGLAYDFTPHGATFEPAITFTWSYDPDALPEGVAEEDLVIAYCDEDAGKWVEVDCVVDTKKNTITASVEHFTTFAIIGTVKPAAFTVSSLHIFPTEVAPGEEVKVSLWVANTGGLEGHYTVLLKINGVKEADKRVTVAATRSEAVIFSVTRKETATYSVVVDGLSGSFTVVAPVIAPPPPPPPPVPAPVPPPVVPAPPPTVVPAPAPAPPAPNWPLIGGLIAGAIIVALLIFFLVRRRAA